MSETTSALLQRYSTPSSVLFRDLGGEAVLLDIDSGLYFGLDEVGTRIWTLLDRHREMAPVCQALAEEYEVGEDRLAADVQSFVGTLLDRGLLCVEAGS